MEPEMATHPGPPRSLRCPKCSSADIRRTTPRNGRERLLRRLLPVHLVYCRACEQRSWIWGSVPGAPHSTLHPRPAGGREMEARDRALARRTRHRLLRTALMALLLGTVFGLYVTHCQEQRRLREEAAFEQERAP
jgi:hypothetical protein